VNVPTLLTLADVAEATRLHRRTIERAVAAGELETVKIGRATRVTTDAYVEWISGRTGKRVPGTPRDVLNSPVGRSRRPRRGVAGPVTIPTE
jgi:excisionase family DNA binding protein